MTLPLSFGQLAPLEFERLCLWLVIREGFEAAEHLGAAGSEQGRDIVARRDDRRWAFQCKRVQTFTVSHGQLEVSKIRSLSPEEQPHEYVFIVTRPVRADTRKAIRDAWGEESSCHFWTGTELDEKVKRHADILEEFFGWRVSGEKPLVSSDRERLRRGSGSTSHPSRWWSFVKGSIDLWLSQKLLLHIASKNLRKGIEQPLASRLERDITIPLKRWASRPSISPPDGLGMLIVGLAGAGKTRFLHELFIEEVSRHDLVLQLQANDLKLALDRGDHGILWRQILHYYWVEEPVDFNRKLSPTGLRRKLTPAAIACALSRRRVLVVIEDIHAIGTFSEVATFLREYFETHHRWGSHLTLLATTRRPASRKSGDLITADYQVVDLKPLDRKSYEPQEFFLDICKANGVDVQVSQIGEALAEGFSTAATRSPLFIAICAWLAINSEDYKRELSQLLRLHSAKIFEYFVDELFLRALSDGMKLDAFRQTYGELAISLWPRWRDFTEAEIDHALSHSKERTGAALELCFLEQSGFLLKAQTQFGAPRWSFPHQSMADYLAAEQMLRSHDFMLLPRRLDDGILGFLVGMIEGPDALLEIAKGDFSAFVAAIEDKPDLLARGVHREDRLAEKVAGVAAGWVSFEAPMRLKVEVWTAAGNLLPARWYGWCDLFCEHLPGDRALPSAIEALAALGAPSCEQVLYRWLTEKNSWRNFLGAVDAKPVGDFLIANVVGSAFSTGVAKTSLDILAERGHYDALCTIGDLCTDMSLAVKGAISSRLASKMGYALIPTGRYSVMDGERKRAVEIEKTVLVPCATKSIPGSFGNKGAAVLRIGRKVTESDLMTWEQALVVHNHFRHSGPVNATQGGVLFGSSTRDAYYEAFRTSVSGIGVFYESVGTEGRGRRIYQLRTASTEQPQAGLFITGLRYREVIVP